MCGREPMSIWYHTFNKHGRLRSKHRMYGGYFHIFKRREFWHDSFGWMINRWFLCPTLGHRNVKNISDRPKNRPEIWYCFNCEKQVGKK